MANAKSKKPAPGTDEKNVEEALERIASETNGPKLISNDEGPKIVDNTDARHVTAKTVESEEFPLLGNLKQVNYK